MISLDITRGLAVIGHGGPREGSDLSLATWLGQPSEEDLGDHSITEPRQRVQQVVPVLLRVPR
jgi:hypothetical protein